ncbi:glutamate synthase subunit beta [Psychromonas sp. CNPT3]|uniref:glutamate synthase subunit beta n=1 Tax=Psychromonas sp. CNPT3 TaxID=314282 RepID=UPI00006E348B|nr:glutamate synthase subunit beta [Psychromonas sp. CNPT3]AGH80589.1 glutamate synthase subunit beta [Psychromonas sp. CNPT3]
MGKATGFLELGRELPGKLSVTERLKNNKEFVKMDEFSDKISSQASRCMDCGVPFCHNGCPIGNIIPEFNDAVYRDSWEEAWHILSSTNNFPEFTGRVCPAPCETSCVLGINQDPITICNIEKTIVETAYREGYVKPKIPTARTGKSIAIIGSGPAGLAAAEQLNSAGHFVTVYERDEKVGGLLRFGIPDFKLGSDIIDRKVSVLEAAGIKMVVNAHIGVTMDASELRTKHDVVLLTGGSTVPRDLPIPGRDLKGVHFAMEFLGQNNRRANAMDLKTPEIHAQDDHVLVIGGGDTGSDCVGTSNRHGAASILQIEIMPIPPEKRNENMPWPSYPMILKTTTSHEEGVDRKWSILTKAFKGDENGYVKELIIADIEWQSAAPGERPNFKEVPGTERSVPCTKAFLAMGFLHPEPTGVLAQLDIALDDRGNVKTTDFQTSQMGVFAAGDMRTGQSLIVRCINEGRECARAIDIYLMGNSNLECISSSLMQS